MKKSAMCMLGIVMSVSNVFSQSALKLGDKLPDIVLKAENAPGGKITSADLKGKLVIFDFWSRFCKGCLEKFPGLQRLQNKYGDKLSIILVNSRQTTDTEEKGRAALKKFEATKKVTINLPVVYMDTVLEKLFPHRWVPYYAWINIKGEFEAGSFPNEVNDYYVAKGIKGERLDLHQRKDSIGFDREKPLLLGSYDDHPITFRSMILPYRDGLKQIDGELTVNGNSSRFLHLNVPLINLYTEAFPSLKGLHKDLYFFAPGLEDFKKQILNGDHYDNKYSYELITNEAIKREKALEFLPSDLERSFGVTVKDLTTDRDVIYVESSDAVQKKLIRTPIYDSKGVGIEYMPGISIGELLDQLNNICDYHLIDNTNIEQGDKKFANRLLIELPPDFQSFDRKAVLNFLRQNGFMCRLGNAKIPTVRFSRVQRE